jgi:Chaperone of endosialidase
MFSQSTPAFKYQAVIRNNGQIIANTSVGILIKLIQGSSHGSLVYSEVQNQSTNQFGLINLIIGDGTSKTGSITGIDWSNGPYYLETDVDIAGGTNYKPLGSVQLLSVPYALYSDKSRRANQFEVDGNNSIPADSALFVVKDKNGEPIFTVYETGVEISYNVSSSTKGAKGGFTVGGRGSGKGPLQQIMQVTTDSIRMYIDTTSSKGSKSGFSVGGRSTTKDEPAAFFNISGSSQAFILNPSQSRIFWYPRKEAFLTGRVLVESPDSVGTNSTATGFESKAIGNWSQALGYQTIARRDYSTAIGKNAIASGFNSFAFGDGAKALNNDAYAFGAMTEARGTGSFAFGYVGRDSLGPTGHITTAIGDWSFAFGLGAQSSSLGDFALGIETRASGGFSTALGFQTMAKSWNDIAMGDSTVASGVCSTTMGYKTIASAWASLAINQETMASGGQSFAGGYLSLASGGASFTFGYKTIASNWTSMAFGQQTLSSGTQTFAGGIYSQAIGDRSFSFGDSTIASGMESVSFGNRTKASSWLSMAIGNVTQATGVQSFSGGWLSKSIGANSFAFGSQTQAISWNDFAIGDSSIASGGPSVALDYQTTASGWASFSSGNRTTASGNVSVAIGSNTIAAGSNSLAAGASTIANGSNSLTGGDHSQTIGSNAIAYGQNALAIGNNSASFGFFTKAKSFATLAIGMFNDTTGVNPYWSNGTDPAFVIGNGWSDSNRSNAFTVLQNGNVGIAMANPQQRLDIKGGNARVESGFNWLTNSDIRYKKNITTLNNSLEKVLRLRGVRYDLKNDENSQEGSGKYIGFIAQELEKEFPEFVITTSDGLKAVAYDKLGTVIVEAIKEQQHLIESLQLENETLKQENDKLLKRLEKLEGILGVKTE